MSLRSVLKVMRMMGMIRNGVGGAAWLGGQHGWVEQHRDQRDVDEFDEGI